MYYFQCDYAEGAHPKILEKLVETNMMQTPGYGCDDLSEAAREKIKVACERDDVDVHFLVGGTQTNTTIIASILKAHQAPVAVQTGHIAGHETGAIEATGHKVYTIPTHDGKMDPVELDYFISGHFNNPIAIHEPQPGLVYISLSTETGTCYTKAEIKQLADVAHHYGMPIFVDGARLGYALNAPDCDVTLKDLCDLVDVFYIGGTKCGALFGEAVVIVNPMLKKDFRYHIKQHGGLLAKGRLLAIQFDVLFTNHLYVDICRQAVDYAMQIRKALIARGVMMYGASMTNQQFPILSKAQIAHIKEKIAFEAWGVSVGQKEVMRLCTSWATTQGAMDVLLERIQTMPQE